MEANAMTNDEIIEMANQAKLPHDCVRGEPMWLDKLEEFAKLVAEKALETKDEPVAWGMEKDGIILDVICPDEHEREEGGYTTPLYTTPQSETKNEPVAWEQFHEHMAGPNYVAPQNTWVGLNKEEIDQGLLRSFYVLEKARAWRDGVAWAMQQLKDKNA